MCGRDVGPPSSSHRERIQKDIVGALGGAQKSSQALLSAAQHHSRTVGLFRRSRPDPKHLSAVFSSAKKTFSHLPKSRFGLRDGIPAGAFRLLSPRTPCMYTSVEEAKPSRATGGWFEGAAFGVRGTDRAMPSLVGFGRAVWSRGEECKKKEKAKRNKSSDKAWLRVGVYRGHILARTCPCLFLSHERGVITYALI